MKKYFRDFYGCTASIAKTRSGLYELRVFAGKTTKKRYETYRGARAAMSRMSDGWREVPEC